jgi:hypothetical protein
VVQGVSTLQEICGIRRKFLSVHYTHLSYCPVYYEENNIRAWVSFGYIKVDRTYGCRDQTRSRYAILGGSLDATLINEGQTRTEVTLVRY